MSRKLDMAIAGREGVAVVNTVIHGDCLEVMQGMPEESADSVVTDPPFKISQEYSTNADADNLIAVSGVLLAAQELIRICKPGSIAVVFYDMRILPLALFGFTRAGWQYLRGLTFYRRWGNANKLYGWMSTSDFMLVFTKPGSKFSFYGDWKHDVYVKDGPEKLAVDHPAQKPLGCIEHLVSHVTPPGGVVLDPYIGSGTTAISALNTGRFFIGIEKEEKYVDIARKRIAEHQHQQSVEVLS